MDPVSIDEDEKLSETASKPSADKVAPTEPELNFVEEEQEAPSNPLEAMEETVSSEPTQPP